MSSALEPVWDAIESALDERRDPLADPRVVQHLAADPMAAREYAAFAARLDLLESSTVDVEAPRRREHAIASARVVELREDRVPSRAWRVAAAVIVLACIGATLVLMQRPDEDPEIAHGTPPHADERKDHDDPEASSRTSPPDERASASTDVIRAYRIEREYRSPDAWSRTVLLNGRLEHRSSSDSTTGALAVTFQRTSHGRIGRETP